MALSTNLDPIDWKVNETKIILDSNLHNVIVTATRENPRSFRQFGSKFNQYKLKIKNKKYNNSSDITHMSLKEIGLIQLILSNFYNEIMSNYPNNGKNLFFQMDLHIDHMNSIKILYVEKVMNKTI